MKKRWLLRILIIVAILWCAILIAIYLITNNYRDYAINYLKDYLDKKLNTEIVIRKNDIHFSLFRNFPHISIWMDDLLVKSAPGPDYTQFSFHSKDTLLFAENISLIFNLKSLFTKKYELRKVEVNKANLNILYDKAGNDNYTILKQNPNEKDSLSLHLKKIELREIKLNFINLKSNIHYESILSDAAFSGKITDNTLELHTSVISQKSTLKIASIEYLSEESLKLKADIFDNKDLTQLKKGILSIFGINFNIHLDWNKQSDIYKLLVESNISSIHKINNIYLNQIYKKYNFSPDKGILFLQLSATGKANYSPRIILKYQLSKATFENKEKEIRFEKVFLKGSYTNGKLANFANSVISIDSLSFKSGESEIYANLNISDLNNPFIKGQVRGNIELEKIVKLSGIQSEIELNGIIHSQVLFKGILPSFNQFKPSYLKNLSFYSQIDFSDVVVTPMSSTLPSALVSGKIYFNTLNEINLEKISFITGNSKFIMDGVVSNIPFLNENKEVFLTYKCTVHSPEFHVEDFLINGGKDQKRKSDLKVNFPDSIIIKAAFNADLFSFGKFNATKVKGDIIYFPKTLTINNFSMDSQDGEILSTISIRQNDKFFKTNFNASLDKINIRSLFESLNDFGQTVIKSENIGGKLSGNVNVDETWDEYLNPLTDQLNLQADYEISDGEILNYQPMLGLSRFIEVEELKHIRFQKLQSAITVSNKTVYFSQTDIRSSAMNLTGSGEHHFDNSYEYHFQVLLSDILWNKARRKKPQNTEFGYVIDDGLNRTALPLVIKGKGTNYDVSYDRKAAANNFKEKVNKEKEELKMLFRSVDQNQDSEINQTEERIEWEENIDQIKITKDTSVILKNTKKDKQDDFSIQWDDN